MNEGQGKGEKESERGGVWTLVIEVVIVTTPSISVCRRTSPTSSRIRELEGPSESTFLRRGEEEREGEGEKDVKGRDKRSGERS